MTRTNREEYTIFFCLSRAEVALRLKLKGGEYRHHVVISSHFPVVKLRYPELFGELFFAESKEMKLRLRRACANSFSDIVWQRRWQPEARAHFWLVAALQTSFDLYRF